jgi:ketosteroid isomerase-like protein
MAKKTARKTTKKSTVKKTRRVDPLKPVKVSTGRGPKPAEIAKDFVKMFNRGVKDQKIWDKWFNRNFESTEGRGLRWIGRRAVQAKCDQWADEYTIHSSKADAVYVGATGFAVRFMVDLEHKPTGRRHEADEIGIYTVRNGKIVAEEFMYG